MGHYDRLSQTENDRCISLTRPSLGLPVVSFRHECKAGLKVSFKKCKGCVKLIKFQIYASFTSALHRSKVMFSCCVCSRQVNVVCVTPTEWVL